MKKTIIKAFFVTVLILSLSVNVFADHMNGKSDWVVEYDGKDLKANFTSSNMADDIEDLQPGDDITFTVTLKSNGDKDADWWMNNSVVDSFEDSSNKAAGGAYGYELIYTGSDGTQSIIYSSETVGGDDITDGAGLHEATGALEDFFFLETLKKGEVGTITLKITLDGETQGNGYQSTLADLEMSFAVEERTNNPTTVIVRTGDDTNLSPYLKASTISGIGLLVLAAVRVFTAKRSVRYRRSEED